MVRLPGGLLFTVMLLVAVPALGQETPADVAKQLYAEGKEAYEQLKFQLAYDRFKSCYALSHQPELLFNMSSAEQGLGHPKAAAELLRAYLRVVPDDPDRPGIERRIRALDEQQLLDVKPSPSPQAVAKLPPPPPPPVAPPPPRRWYQDPAGHALLFTGVGLLAAGGALLGIGNARISALDNQPYYGSYVSTRDGAQPLQYSGLALIGAGGVLVLGGIIRFAVADHKKSDR